jgi:predicted O-methyltransferase YrrM
MLALKINPARTIPALLDVIPTVFERIPFRRFVVTPVQVREEITTLLNTVLKFKPRTIIEIGTARGGTLVLFTRIASPDAVIVSVDLPSGQFGGGYPSWRERYYHSLATNHQKVVLFRRDSHDPATLRDVKASLGGRQVDFLFIDGDHTYEGVKSDFEAYKSLVRPGGIIAFHDICFHPYDPTTRVNVFWDEIKGNYESKELIQDPDQGWGGIGMIFL